MAIVLIGSVLHGERRFAMGAEFKQVYSKAIDDIVDRLWAMRDLDQEITALNNRRPINAANAAGVRYLDFVTPAFAQFLKIPDPEVGAKHWEIGTSGPGYLWPPRQLTPGQQMALDMMAKARKEQEAARAAYYAEHGSPT